MRIRTFNISGFNVLTVNAECPVIDIIIFCSVADRFMLQLDLANHSDHHIWGHFPLCVFL